jgi:hypothetical protein
VETSGTHAPAAAAAGERIVGSEGDQQHGCGC